MNGKTILDWSSLSQVIQQGPQGVLEQALRSTGSNLARLDLGLGEISERFEQDYKAFAVRHNVETIVIEADLTKNTLENRRLGVVFDENAGAGWIRKAMARA